MSSITIVGIDCACNPKDVGLALATLEGGRTSIRAVRTASPASPPDGIVAEWLAPVEGPCLLALDAPLGWPSALGDTLRDHAAGTPIAAAANTLFRRDTDRFVQETLGGPVPLSVGADRIARTAHAALALLGQLRNRLDQPIPLAWGDPFETTAAIEVYPAASLAAHGLRAAARGYKGAEGHRIREKLLRKLPVDLTPGVDAALITSSDHVFDAVICVLAAVDFLTGSAVPPPDPELARREGWIWVRRPQSWVDSPPR